MVLWHWAWSNLRDSETNVRSSIFVLPRTSRYTLSPLQIRQAAGGGRRQLASAVGLDFSSSMLYLPILCGTLYHPCWLAGQVCCIIEAEVKITRPILATIKMTDIHVATAMTRLKPHLEEANIAPSPDRVGSTVTTRSFKTKAWSITVDTFQQHG